MLSLNAHSREMLRRSEQESYSILMSAGVEQQVASYMRTSGLPLERLQTSQLDGLLAPLSELSLPHSLEPRHPSEELRLTCHLESIAQAFVLDVFHHLQEIILSSHRDFHGSNINSIIAFASTSEHHVLHFQRGLDHQLSIS